MLEIAGAVMLKGVVFELIHQRRQRSLLRQEKRRSASTEHASNRSAACHRLTGSDHAIGAIENRSG